MEFWNEGEGTVSHGGRKRVEEEDRGGWGRQGNCGDSRAEGGRFGNEGGEAPSHGVRRLPLRKAD